MKTTNIVSPGSPGLRLRDKKWCIAKDGTCAATFYSRISQGLCTRPVKIGARGSRWPEHEIEAIVAARVAGRSNEEIRTLVEELHARRLSNFDALVT
jgi:prophage regulatory protein